MKIFMFPEPASNTGIIGQISTPKNVTIAKNSMHCVSLLVLLLALLVSEEASGFASEPALPQLLDQCNVTWTTPSEDSRGSMPLGNGDIGLNVWMEKSGDLLFYISKTDAWSDNVGRGKGLIKLGRVRVKFSPALDAGANFSQTLRLRDGEIAITTGETKLRVWVDANRPVVHVESDSLQPEAMQVAFETLRPAPEQDLQADKLLNGQTNRIVWYYRNQNKSVAELTNLTFGAAISGDGLVSAGGAVLQSVKPVKRQVISIYALTVHSPTPEAWLAQLNQVAAQADFIPLEIAWGEHVKWWSDFWNRSWIFVGGDEVAAKVTQGYALQRFVSACAGRGGAPIKFNGSIFTVDYHRHENIKGIATNYVMSADARAWGGQYWFQNTRPMYWPMLAAGDFDTMQPLFKMFRAMLPRNEAEVRDFYHHDGAYFCETKAFYGGINKLTPEAKGAYTDFYYTPILELSAMMLDYHAYTGDKNFVRDTLLPIADAGVKFFDQHWKHENGKLLLDPDNAIEMFWKARNPAPDIAGLHWVLQGLLALPPDLTSAAQRSRWQRFLGEIPELPTRATNGVKLLLPAEVFGGSHNSENPELYSIYPFRIFGLGKPELQLARDTFAARQIKSSGCWVQDGVQAALLGDTEVARKNVVFNLTRQDKQLRFPAFWDPGHDYAPDEDNGGNGLNILQTMLLQAEGQRIILLPAWPNNWNAGFKLHAPLNTTVEGVVRAGKIESLTIMPPERRKDVLLANPDGNLRKLD